jgi:hypothetical protein
MQSWQVDRNDTTPLVARRLENRQNVRALIFGDSISGEPLMGDYYGVLRQLQEHIGNAGAGGYNVNTEAIPVYGGGTAAATSDWFRTYHSVPAAGWVEFSANGQIRRFCNTAKVAWRAPVGGTATFKIQTCSDLDGAGVGTWVDDPAGVRTAVASGASEEVGYATLTLTEGSYRLRVLGVSGTVNVFNMELSHSTIGGCIINYHGEGGTEFSAWRNLSDTRRENFIDAVDPDVIFVMYKDDSPNMVLNLAALAETLETALAGSYPRDVVIIAPFPSIPPGSEFWEPTRIQREVMRLWAYENRAAFIDLWELFPINAIYYDGPGIHGAGVTEQAHMGALILDRLGWYRYPKVKALVNPAVRTARRSSVVALANSTTFAEDTVFRMPLGVGLWRITGRFLFTNDGSVGEGAKVQISHSGAATLVVRNYKRWAVNGNTQVSVYPYFGGTESMPVVMNSCTTFDLAYGYDLDQLDINVTQPGILITSTAKEATGGDVHLREGSFIKAEKLP